MSLSSWNYNPAGKNVGTLGSNEYMEAKGSGNITSSPGSTGISRTFFINYDYVPSFLDALLGYSVYISSASPAFQRVLPDQHPLYPNYYAMEATVEGWGTCTKNSTFNIPTYTAAKIVAQYRPPTYFLRTDAEVATDESKRYVTRKPAISGDYFTIQGGMQFVPAGGIINQPPARVTGVMEITYIWHNVPCKSTDPFQVPNLSNLITCLGKVNNAAFDTSSLNAPAGTVLFLGADPAMNTNRVTTGSAELNYSWDITMKFLYRNNGLVAGLYAGHQHLFNQGTGAWTLITADGTVGGVRLYQETDLNAVFSLS